MVSLSCWDGTKDSTWRKGVYPFSLLILLAPFSFSSLPHTRGGSKIPMPLEFWVSFSFMFVSLRIVSPVSVMSDRTLTINIGFVLDLFEKKMRKKCVQCLPHTIQNL